MSINNIFLWLLYIKNYSLTIYVRYNTKWSDYLNRMSSWKLLFAQGTKLAPLNYWITTPSRTIKNIQHAKHLHLFFFSFYYFFPHAHIPFFMSLGDPTKINISFLIPHHILPWGMIVNKLLNNINNN